MGNEILVTENIAGNWHQARGYCNEQGLSPYVLQFSPMVGNYTIVLFRMPEDLALLLTEKGVIRYTKANS